MCGSDGGGQLANAQPLTESHEIASNRPLLVLYRRLIVSGGEAVIRCIRLDELYSRCSRQRQL